MGRVQLATAGLEAFAMALSLMLGEFTAERIWMVQASVFLAIIVTIGLIPAAQGSYYEGKSKLGLDNILRIELFPSRIP